MSNTSKDKLIGESDGKTISYQQQLVWDRLHSAIDIVRAANDSMTNKASTLLSGGGLALGVSSTATVLAENSDVWAMSLNTVCGTIVFLMALIAGSLWTPSEVPIAGTNDVSSLYENYLTRDVDSAFNLAMGRSESVYSKERERNAKIAFRLGLLVKGLDVSIIILICNVLIASMR